MEENYFRFTPSVVLFPFLLLLLMWGVFWTQSYWLLDLHTLAIMPRDWRGLPGILCSVVLHGSVSHILNNTIALAVLLPALIFFYRNQSLRVIFFGVLISGSFTWLFGRPNYHLGASGLIYALFSFIFFKGIFTRYYRLVALSLAVIVSYGGMVWYVFPGVDNSISWEGHLGGFIGGLVMALMYKTPRYTDMISYDWQKPDFDPAQDKFMQRFDENGNFVNPTPPEPTKPDEAPGNEVVVHYHFVPSQSTSPVVDKDRSGSGRSPDGNGEPGDLNA